MTVPVACNACGLKPEYHTEREQRFLSHPEVGMCDARGLVIADGGGEPSGPDEDGQTDRQIDDALADRWNAVMTPPASTEAAAGVDA